MDMFQMIKSFPNQIKDQYENLKSLDLDNTRYENVNKIVIAGMGGSAISGDFVRLLLKNDIEVPIYVVRDYSLPKWCDKNTLFILSSYSGNTEETLSIYDQAKSISNMLISVSTGGCLVEKSKADGVCTVGLPKGFQPRAALGFSLITLIVIFNKLYLIEDKFVDVILNSADNLFSFFKEFCDADGYAYNIAHKIGNSFLLIYGTESGTDVVAFRFRAQLAENAKFICSHHSVPELTHNEIEGWNRVQFNNIKKNIIWLEDKDDHAQITNRVKITSDLLEELDVQNIFIKTDGNSHADRLLKLVYLTDWISYYLAKINGIDPIPVERIESLKKRLLS